MRADVRPLSLASGPGRCRCYIIRLPRIWSIVLISVALLCSGISCGRKGPLKPLKKEAPSYNLAQTGRAPCV
jgi:predicted small lipoprotein YifL